MPWNTFDTSFNYGAPAGGGGGLLGIPAGAWENLGNLGYGLLASSAPSTTGPVTFGSALGKAGLYAAERRDQGLLNDARRMQIAASAQESKAKAALLEGIKSGAFTIPGMDPTTAGALLASGNESLAAKLIPQALTPEAQAQVAAGYPAIVKAQQDVTKENQLQGIERVTSNTTVRNALEAENIITRMEKGPVPPGSTAATLAKKLSDPDGYITVSPSIVAQASATVLGGKPMTEAQAAQWQTDWNRLNKLSAKFITDQRSLQAQQGATGGQSRQTDFGLSFIEQQNISPTVTGNANRAILSDLIQRQRDIAKIRGWDLDNSDKIDETLKRWESQLTPVVDYSTPPPEGAAPPPAAPAAPFALPPGVGVSPAAPPVQAGAAPSAAPPAAPPVRPVTTQRMVNVPPQAATGTSPAFAGGPLPMYPRKADGERAVPHGWFLTPDGGLWYQK